MHSERYAVVDVETTGLSPSRERIVEIACVSLEGEALAGRWSTLVDPSIAIPAYATAVHGITEAMVSFAPALADALAELRGLCADRVVAAHCANFDLSFLGPTIATRALCTMRLRALVPEAPNFKNQTLRRVLAIGELAGVPLAAHRALDDAIVSAHVFLSCRERYLAKPRGQSWSAFLRRFAFVTPISANERIAS